MNAKQKTILITGATSGIGKATAKLLIDKGHKVIIHGRNKKSSCAVCSEFGCGRLVVPVWGDLSDLRQVRLLAKQVIKITPTLDCLVLNAGVFQTNGKKSSDGFELDFAVNYLSHFLLAHLLIEKLSLAKNSRIIFVSSSAYINGKVDAENFGKQYFRDPMMAYATSKQLCLLAALELARRLSKTDVCVNALNPGPTATALLKAGKKYGWRNVGDSPDKAARKIVWLATEPSLEKVSGKYYNDKKTPNVPKRLRDDKLLSAIYEKSACLCGAKFL